MTGDTPLKTIVLGSEYDSALIRNLLQILNDFRAVRISQNHGMGGSQEISTVMFQIGEDRVVVETETYVGLSISGRPEIVDQISAQVKVLLARQNR